MMRRSLTTLLSSRRFFSSSITRIATLHYRKALISSLFIAIPAGIIFKNYFIDNTNAEFYQNEMRKKMDSFV